MRIVLDWRKLLKKNIIFYILFILFQGIVLLLIHSAIFLKTEFGELAFETVLYQLSSPLVGTGQEVFNSYIDNCVKETLIYLLIISCIYIVVGMGIAIIKKGKYVQVNFRINTNNFTFNIREKQIKTSCLVLVFSLALMELFLVWKQANAVGIPQYVKSISQSSTIFEEEYVAPDTVAITFPEKKRNVIVLYLESMESTYFSVEEGGGKKVNLIPELTQLAVDNISFSDTELLGGGYNIDLCGWTMAALLSTTSGVPYRLPVEGNSAGNYEEFLPGIITLGDILSANGYNNYFLCGSDAEFGGRELYFTKHGNYTIYDYNTAIEEDVVPPDYYEFWGIEDCKLYDIAKQELSRIALEEAPFNYMMLTVDTHHSDGYECELCQNEHGEQFPDAISCASRQATEFIEWVQKQEWYENTSIVVIGDHRSMNATFWDDLPANYERKIYNCFINVKLADGKEQIVTKNRGFSALDMFPTILSVMGVEIEGDRLGLGVDLFSDKETLIEKYGFSNFNKELMRKSKYFNNEFIYKEKTYK